MIDLTGQQFGNYRLQRLLGTGGFASVYLGQHLHLASKQAAIKLLHLFDVDVHTFQQEAETTEQLVHPHIVRLLDFAFHNGTPFLVMDYAPGGSLRTRHSHGTPLPLPTVVQYLTELAPALQYAHDQHILHRDIKPDNILIGRHGELLLSDFGIAVLSRTGRTSLPPTHVGGTPYYMAPEMFRGKPEKASDQYALGVLVYEWLCGTRPFPQGDFIQLGFQHTYTPPPPLREHVPSLSTRVEAVVLKALAKDPNQRFASVQVFAQALEIASLEQIEDHVEADAETKKMKRQSDSDTERKQWAPQIEADIKPSPQIGEQRITKRPGSGNELEKSPSTGNELEKSPGTRDELQSRQGTGNELQSRQGTGNELQPQQNINTEKPEGPIDTDKPEGPTDTDKLKGTQSTDELKGTQSTDELKGTQSTDNPDAGKRKNPVQGPKLDQWGDQIQATYDTPIGDTNVDRPLGDKQHDPDRQFVQPSSTPEKPPGTTLEIYRGHTGQVRSVAWSPDSRFIASAAESPQVWEATTGILKLEFKAHSKFVNCLAWSLDGKKIATGYSDHSVQVWDYPTGNLLTEYKANLKYAYSRNNSIAFSPDGKYIASLAEDSVEIWESSTGIAKQRFGGHHVRAANCVTWSPDGTKIAIGDYDKTVQVWDVDTRERLAEYQGHYEWISAVAWSPDGTKIASGAQDKLVHVWDCSASSAVWTEDILTIRFSSTAASFIRSLEGTRKSVWIKRMPYY